MHPKLADLFSGHLEEILELETDALSRVWHETIAPSLAEIGVSLDPMMAGAFLAGGLAMVAGARLAMIGALVVLGAHIAVTQGGVGDMPAWVMPTAGVFLLLGIAQGVLTLVAGEQTAGTLLAAGLLALVLFVIWRGPLKGLRLILFIIQRIGGR